MFERKPQSFYEGEVQRQHPNFFAKLRNICPSLNVEDVKVCIFVRLHIEPEEIMLLFRERSGVYYNHRSRLRKKLGLKKGENLAFFLMAL